MDYNVGKVYNFNKKIGVGYIITKEAIYMFTINDLMIPVDELNDGDLVRFKGEKVYNKTYKAFFIKKMILK